MLYYTYYTGKNTGKNPNPERSFLDFSSSIVDNVIDDFVERIIEQPIVSNVTNQKYCKATDKEFQIQLPMLGVRKDALTIDFDPTKRSVTAVGKVYSEFDSDDVEPKTVKYDVVVPRKYSTTPTMCKLVNGYLYIKFELDQNSQKVQFDIE